MPTPTKEEVAELYIATFDRAPEQEGLDYWVNSGLSINEIAESFFEQSETQELYPEGTTNIGEFITNVYNNVLDRAPDKEGFDYWYQELDNGNLSESDLILAVINGAKEHEADAQTLAYKDKIGLAFAESGSEDMDLAKELMTQIDPHEIDIPIEEINIENLQSYLNSDNVDSYIENVENVYDTFSSGSFGHTDTVEG